MTKEVTLKQFKEWLNRFPDDTIVQVTVQQQAGPWEAYGPIEFKSPELEPVHDAGLGWEFIDLTENKFVKPTSPHHNKRYLTIGEPS